MGMMIKSNINHRHFLLVGFLFLVAYPLCISGAAFPHAYGLHQIDRSTPALTPSYRIRFMNRTSFPSDFVFGAASSAYQIEGAWNESGKGPSNWDNFTHQYPGKILNNSNGDVACNSYNLYKDDVSLLKNMSLDSYRFSIAWSRVIPTGRRSDGVNEDGITYYQNLIDELHKNSIEPSITLFHWDVPQGLEDEYGGFLSPNIVDDFRDYADLCFERFGPKVKSWITLNEPWSFSTSGYESGGFAPGRCSSWIDPTCTGGNSSTEPYITAHYQLLGHSAVVKLYREKYQTSQNGKIGPTLVSTWMVPYTKNASDVRAAARALEFMLGWFMEPIVFGQYPRSMRRLVGDRLPTFTATQSLELRGSFDFVGINYYTAFFAVDTSDEPYTTNLRYTSDYRANLTYVGPDGNLIGVQAGSSWLHIYPVGIWKLLTYIRLKYNNPIVYVTENGVDEVNNATLALEVALQDNFRVVYYYQHLAHVLKAIHEGANVAGYYAWSIMDNFEWAAGYSVRFGVNYVDFEDGFKRYAKLSAKWFNRFLIK